MWDHGMQTTKDANKDIKASWKMGLPIKQGQGKEMNLLSSSCVPALQSIELDLSSMSVKTNRKVS